MIFKVGRYTAGILLAGVGVILLLDRFTDIHLLDEAMLWWPVIFIILGFEFFLLGLVYRRSDRRMKFDFPGLIFSLLVVLAVFGGSWSVQWPFHFFVDKGTPFQLEVVSIPVQQGTESVVITNLSGSAVLRSGDVPNIQIQPTVWVNHSDPAKASDIAHQAKIAYSEGAALRIHTEGQSYTSLIFSRKPQIDLVITLPRNQFDEIEVQLKNGDADIVELTTGKRFSVQSSNGKLNLLDINSEHILAKTSNGQIYAERIAGTSQFSSTNAGITVNDIQGKTTMKTTNGSLQATAITGSLNAATTNGKIAVHHVTDEVLASTTNGSVEVSSTTVNGNWDLRTTNGKMTIAITDQADVYIQGKTTNGNISTDFPFHISKKEIEGRMGQGKFRILLKTTNGNINVQKIQ